MGVSGYQETNPDRNEIINRNFLSFSMSKGHDLSNLDSSMN